MSPLKCGIDLIFTSKKIFFLFFPKILGLQFLDCLYMSPLKCGIDLIFTSKKKFFFYFFQKFWDSNFWTDSTCRLLSVVLILSLLV
jgi:hypothetical protein